MARLARKDHRRGRGKVLLALAVGVFLGLRLFGAHHQEQAGATSHGQKMSAGVSLADASSCAGKQASGKRVGIQAGHWQIDQLPDELSAFQWDFGASSGGVNEVDVNLDVAQKTAAILKKDGIQADVLPATVPVDYCANAFVAIHADGNDDPTAYGYKVAPSYWDTDGRAQALSDDIQVDYGKVTGMGINTGISDNMTQYYSFNYQKHLHAIDQDTPGVLIELGFITNGTDRSMLTDYSQTLAQGVAKGIEDYLKGSHLPTPEPTAD